ncbi:MAG: PP2C family protein-serine/threonine phosphatase [Planctomycetaceae bacterium]
MQEDARSGDGLPWFSPEELYRFAEFLSGDAPRDQRNIQFLLEMVAETLRQPDVEALMRTLLDRAIRTTASERGILLLNEEGQLRVRLARDSLGRDLGTNLKLSRRVPAAVIADGTPVISRVGADEESLELTDSVSAMRLRQVMCAPLRIRSRTLGALYVDSKIGGPPPRAADLMLFNTQAGLIAMAIENHKLQRDTVEAGALREQLRVARDIQRRLLPEGPAVYAGLELAGKSEPFERVGGDYFDYFPVDTGRVGFAIADVSGHGVGPALVMSDVRAHLRSLLETRRSLGGLYGLMNRALCTDLAGGMFVSLFVAVYDSKVQRLEYQNAGHNAPVIYSPTRDRFVEIPSNAPALGIISDISAGPCPSLTLSPGDYVICYTDGVTEAPSPGGELFGEERLHAIVREVARSGGHAVQVVDSVLAGLRKHMAGRAARDDVTLLVAKA